MGSRKEQASLWVRLTLWELPGRFFAKVFCWLSVGCGIASCVYGYWDWRYFLAGVAFFCTALVVVRYVFIGYYYIPQDGMWPGMPAGSRLFAVLRPYQDISEVERGDIILFERNKDGQLYDLIWRVVGLPGDHIRTTRSAVFLNDKSLTQEAVRSDREMVIFREVNGDTEYEVAYGEQVPARLPPEVDRIVPAAHLFVLGDNRDNALDSRHIGAVPFEFVFARKW